MAIKPRLLEVIIRIHFITELNALFCAVLSVFMPLELNALTCAVLSVFMPLECY